MDQADWRCCIRLILIVAMVHKEAFALHCYSCAGIPSNDRCLNVTECKQNQVCFSRADGFQTGTVTHTTGCIDKQVTLPYLPGRYTFCDQRCSSDFCNLEQCSTKGNHSTGPRCLSCEVINDPAKCSNVVQCAADKVCYVKKFMAFGMQQYRMGCMKKQYCSQQPTPRGMIVGRRDSNATLDTGCSLCCADDHCNAIVCSGSALENASRLLEFEHNQACFNRHDASCAAFAILSKNLCLHPEIVTICPKSCETCGHVGWSEWAPWVACSKSCGQGTTYRRRRCLHQLEITRNQTCVGQSLEQNTCILKQCPVNGAWGSWSNWGGCSDSCAKGIVKRYRSCTNPTPAYGGQDCVGNNEDEKFCNDFPCPVNGGWGPWMPAACTVTCGGGTIYRFRQCISPAPAYGGRNCSGSSHNTRLCNTQHCPVDGGRCPQECRDVYYPGYYGKQCEPGRCRCPIPAYGGKDCT